MRCVVLTFASRFPPTWLIDPSYSYAGVMWVIREVETMEYSEGRLYVIDRGGHAYLEFQDKAGDNKRKRWLNISQQDATIFGTSPVVAASVLFNHIIEQHF